MKVTDLIVSRKGKPFASFEIVPPLKGSDTGRLYSSVRPLMDFNPPFINFTAHRDETEYRANPDGFFTKVTVTKRPSTLAIVAAISREFRNVEIVPHVICGGATADRNESLLLDLHFLGIQNIMALRGDAAKGSKYFEPTQGGHAHCSELVSQIANMNRGVYLDSNMKNPETTDFCVGVGAYPEKHIEAPNLETDIGFLKKKVDAGASYIITQMFFDNGKFFAFEKKCREAGITVPIIPGLKPVSTLRQVKTLPQAFAIDFPTDFVIGTDRIRRLCAPDNIDAALHEFGVEWCVAQCRELLAHGVPAIHFYTMGRADNVRAVVSKVF